MANYFNSYDNMYYNQRNNPEKKAEKVYTFEEVESGIEQFTGGPIGVWLEDMEILASKAGWNEFEKCLFVRRNIVGRAREVLKFQCPEASAFSTCDAMRTALLSYFGCCIEPQSGRRPVKQCSYCKKS